MSGPARPILPVILCGGAGTRLWPVSTEAAPKPFHALLSDKSLFQMTVARIAGHGEDGFLAPMIVCGRTHRALVEAQLEAIGVEAALLVLEPCGRGTAPIAAIAAALAAERWPEAVVLLLSADHLITDEAEFRRTIRGGAAIADDWIVTLGVAPTRPETGYGYIRRGAAIAGAEGCYEVAAFVEKPDRAHAEAYLATGEYSWNSGIFLLPASILLHEMERLRPATLAACRQALERAKHDLDFLRLDRDAFAAAENVSIDYAVMEHTRHAAVVPVEIGWSDVGTWDALWQIADKDDRGNVLIGDIVAEDVRNSYLRAETGMIDSIRAPPM